MLVNDLLGQGSSSGKHGRISSYKHWRNSSGKHGGSFPGKHVVSLRADTETSFWVGSATIVNGRLTHVASKRIYSNLLAYLCLYWLLFY